MKKISQKRRILAAALAAVTVLVSGIGAYAAPAAVYNRQDGTISVTGIEETGSKASLVVFSPKYNLSTYDGIEYFDVQDIAADGSYTFAVPALSEQNKAIGDYLCRVDIFGGDEVKNYTLDVYYPFGADGLTKLRRFDYNTEGDNFSATAWFSDNQVNANYKVIIGLYKENTLLDVALSSEIGAASGATGWQAPLTAAIAKNAGADMMKAFLLDISQTKPLVSSIEVPLNK